MLQIIRYTCVVLFLFFIFCQRHDPYHALQENIDREINDRLSVLKNLSKYDDSLQIKAQLIHTKINELMLLSKDVENPMAVINKANAFFDHYKDFDAAGGIRKIRPVVNKQDIEIEIKENELWILNQMIFQYNGADLHLFSVTEEQD